MRLKNADLVKNRTIDQFVKLIDWFAAIIVAPVSDAAQGNNVRADYSDIV